MIKPLRHIGLVVLLMFALLFGSTSWVQYVQADSLRADSRNSRTLIDDLSRPRGPILVAGTPIVKSVKTDDTYKYQRVYGTDKYPARMYANLTGYFSITSGTSGLENAENGLLSGTDDSLAFQRARDVVTGDKTQGAAVEMTIDPKAQRAAWNALGDQHGAAVAMDPRTGQVLAMVSTPGWDPNSLANHDRKKAVSAYKSYEHDSDKAFYNRAIAGNQYPPGSTFKLVTAAAALQDGKNENSKVASPNTLTIGQYTMRNAGGETCGDGTSTTIKDALTISCNTAFANLGTGLGYDKVHKQAEKFGFGKKLNIPLHTIPSQFPNTKGDKSFLAKASIGQQDVKATPLQMAMVSSAIANKGVLMQPQLIKQVKNQRNLSVIEKPSPKSMGRAVSRDTASKLTDMMKNVVTSGTGTAAQIDGAQVAGKTGTAQHAEGGSPHAWFTSFAPAKDPKVAVAVVVENGGSAGSEASGGRVAGPIAKQIMEAVIDK